MSAGVSYATDATVAPWSVSCSSQVQAVGLVPARFLVPQVLLETNTTAYQGERKFQGTGRIEGKQISWGIL